MPRRIGTRYYTDFKFNGQRIRQVMPEARTADQAKRLEAQIRDRYFEGTYGDPAASYVLADFAKTVWLPWCKDNRKTEKAYKKDQYYYEIIKRFFGTRTFAEIGSVLVARFRRERLNTPVRYGNKKKPHERPRTPATVNRELAALSKIFRLAIKPPYKIISENPMSQVGFLNENNERTRYLSPDEETRLMDALLLNPTLTAIVVLAINTGMRKGEILKLEWRDVDFSRNLIHVRETKSDHDRFVPLNAPARAALDDLPRTKAQRWVFHSSSSSGHLVEIKKAWATALRFAGIEDFHFHDLRHTAGSRLAATGAHPNTIKELLGHQNLKTTERYMHAAAELKQAAVAALENFGQTRVKEAKVLNFKQALND